MVAGLVAAAIALVDARIDHLLLSPQAADRFLDAGVDKEYRGRDKASDHAPTWVQLADEEG